MTQTLPLNEIEPFAILSRFKPRPAILNIATEKRTALELLDQLVADHDYNAAFDLVAYSMVPQAVVWWGCLCLWDSERDSADPSFEKAMRLIIQWLQNPQEDRRLAVGPIEKQFDSQHPIRFLCQAVRTSHGSMAPAGLPEVKAPKYLYAAFASGAIKLIAAQSKPDQYSAVCKQILRHGMEVLQGANRWKKH